jgi:hypothetical protein
MAAKSLKIDSIELDLANPRITPATDQRDAMQKILKEQGVKLINLAVSIAANGLNRWIGSWFCDLTAPVSSSR